LFDISFPLCYTSEIHDAGIVCDDRRRIEAPPPRPPLNPDHHSSQRAAPRPFFISEITVTTPPRLTRARLRELLHYDRDTGEFRWWKRVGDGVRLGEVAGHVEIRVDERTYRAHQLAWFYTTGRWGRPMIDHRDGNSTNNRWTNLRRATATQNNANKRRSRQNASGYKGVWLQPSGRWRAAISNKGQRIDLGIFATAEAAHAAYVAAARKLFGEFARAE
jgi:hypothetical protein